MRSHPVARPSLAVLAAVALSTGSSIALADGPVAPLAAAPAADAPARPSDGTAAGVTGTVLGLVGLGALLTIPACTGIGSTDHARECVGAAAGSAFVFLVVGLPLLGLADSQSTAFKEWKAAHPGAAGLGFSAAKSTGSLTWTAQF